MLNNYCNQLKFNFDLDLTPLYNIQKEYTKTDRVSVLNVDEIDNNLASFLQNLDLKICHAEVFHTPAFGEIKIHSDTGRSDITWTKINWVFGPSGHRTRWWRIKDPNKEIQMRPLHNGPDYIFYEDEDCELAYEKEITGGWLFNAGIPHSVWNPTDQSRWTLSYTLYDLKQDRILEYNDALEIFKNYLED
jgi:hypothetical protein